MFGRVISVPNVYFKQGEFPTKYKVPYDGQCSKFKKTVLAPGIMKDLHSTHWISTRNYFSQGGIQTKHKAYYNDMYVLKRCFSSGYCICLGILDSYREVFLLGQFLKIKRNYDKNVLKRCFNPRYYVKLTLEYRINRWGCVCVFVCLCVCVCVCVCGNNRVG